MEIVLQNPLNAENIEERRDFSCVSVAIFFAFGSKLKRRFTEEMELTDY